VAASTRLGYHPFYFLAGSEKKGLGEVFGLIGALFVNARLAEKVPYGKVVGPVSRREDLPLTTQSLFLEGAVHYTGGRKPVS